MARYHFFLAARAFADVQGLPNCSVNDWGNGNGLELRWGAVDGRYPDRTALFAFRGTFVVNSITWRMYQISPLTNHAYIIRALFRALRRAAIAQPRLAGPWGPIRLRALYPALADRFASAIGPTVTEPDPPPPVYSPDPPAGWVGTWPPPYNPPPPVVHATSGMPLVSGDGITDCLAIDYEPSDADCTNDVDTPVPGL